MPNALLAAAAVKVGEHTGELHRWCKDQLLSSSLQNCVVRRENNAYPVLSDLTYVSVET